MEWFFLQVFIQSQLYYNLAIIARHQERNYEALQFCDKAIQVNSQYLKAHVLRGDLLFDKGEFDLAIKSFEESLKHESCTGKCREFVQNRLVNSKKVVDLKNGNKRDYYEVLMVNRKATDAEIRKAYKNLAREHHPDRHATESVGMKKLSESLFKEVGEAYATLSDPALRKEYDALHNSYADILMFDFIQMLMRFQTDCTQ